MFAYDIGVIVQSSQNLFTKINVNLFDVTRKSHRAHPIHLSRILKLQRKRQYRKLFLATQIDNNVYIIEFVLQSLRLPDSSVNKIVAITRTLSFMEIIVVSC